jgi:hypothetical protein
MIDILCATTQAMLLMTAIHKGNEGNPFADIEHTNAFRGMEFVPRNRKEIDVRFFQVDR